MNLNYFNEINHIDNADSFFFVFFSGLFLVSLIGFHWEFLKSLKEKLSFIFMSTLIFFTSLCLVFNSKEFENRKIVEEMAISKLDFSQYGYKETFFLKYCINENKVKDLENEDYTINPKKTLYCLNNQIDYYEQDLLKIIKQKYLYSVNLDYLYFIKDNLKSIKDKIKIEEVKDFSIKKDSDYFIIDPKTQDKLLKFFYFKESFKSNLPLYSLSSFHYSNDKVLNVYKLSIEH